MSENSLALLALLHLAGEEQSSRATHGCATCHAHQHALTVPVSTGEDRSLQVERSERPSPQNHEAESKDTNLCQLPNAKKEDEINLPPIGLDRLLFNRLWRMRPAPCCALRSVIFPSPNTNSPNLAINSFMCCRLYCSCACRICSKEIDSRTRVPTLQGSLAGCLGAEMFHIGDD